MLIELWPVNLVMLIIRRFFLRVASFHFIDKTG